MTTLRMAAAMAISTLAIAGSGAADAGYLPVRVAFVEPAGPTPADSGVVYQAVTDSARTGQLTGWMANESARLALDLYAMAWALTPSGRRGEPAVYHVALVLEANHAAVGLRLADDPNPARHARTPFIMLAPEEWVFSTTLLHETGHVVLALLNGGAEIPRREIAAVPHATAALTDRGTAFDEGFAIHLETLAAHTTSDPRLLTRYLHRRLRFGVPEMLGEYHRHAGDLLSYAQTLARYQEVRDNTFAFAPAYAGPDYLRVQLEKSRDFARLRDANQLLQSEGFYASFFFGLLMRGDGPPPPEVLRQRQQEMLEVLGAVLQAGARQADDPFLLLFVQTWLEQGRPDAEAVTDVLLDLSHGVFLDSRAAALWREHYLGALGLDLAQASNPEIEASRARWRTEVSADPRVLFRLLGPQLRVEVAGPVVTLAAFGEAKPLSFDPNTVDEAIIRLVPGISEPEVRSWVEARRQRPFADAADFRLRSGLAGGTLTSLIFG